MLVYFTDYIISIIGVELLLLNRYSRPFILFLIFIATIIELGYRNLSPLGFSYSDALLIIQEYSSPLVKEAANTYLSFFIKPFFISTAIVAFLYILIKKFKIRTNKYETVIGIIFFIISFGVSYKMLSISYGVRTAYISVIKDPVLLYYASTNKLYVGPREKVSIKLSSKTPIKHIIFIVDESVRGDKLLLNGFKKNTTPFLKSIENKIINYGVASSGGVCSSYSNAILLSGVQPWQLPDKGGKIVRREPLIFQYALKAGYITSYFDMQNTKEKPNNFFQKKDWKYLNYTFFIEESKYRHSKPYNKDLIGLNILTRYISTHKKQKTFTYFVKEGCHFSYIDKYPKNQGIFKPVLEGSSWGEWNLKIRPLFLNTYYNAIRWEVDHFFKELYNKLKGTDSVIIYTSDHGQNLIDNLTIKQTHCAKGPAPIQMTMVPLFIVPMNAKVSLYIKKLYLHENYNHASHFNIFGSLLLLMGYNKNEINKRYMKTLFDNLTNQKRIFTSGDIFCRGKMYKNVFNY